MVSPLRTLISELRTSITYEVVLSSDEPPEFPRDLFREEVPLAVRFRSCVACWT